MSKAFEHVDHAATEAASPLLAMGLRHFSDVPIRAHQLIKRGISSEWIDPVCQHLGLGRGAMAELMGLARGQVDRMSARKSFLPTHAAEMLLRLLELHDMAEDVFGSRANACRWLESPHPMLGDECPRSAIKTSYGATQVKDLLMAVKHGGVV